MPKLGPIGIPELLIILVVVLLIFGPRRLPDMAKGLGQSVREFRRGLRDMRKEFDDEAGPEAGNATPSGASAAASSVNQATAGQTAASAVPAEQGVPQSAAVAPQTVAPKTVSPDLGAGEPDAERRA